MSPAQREAMVRRTVYVSDIDQQVRVVIFWLLAITFVFGIVSFAIWIDFLDTCFRFVFVFVLRIRSLKKTLLLSFSIADR